jgi:hypothetical protein
MKAKLLPYALAAVILATIHLALAQQPGKSSASVSLIQAMLPVLRPRWRRSGRAELAWMD